MATVNINKLKAEIKDIMEGYLANRNEPSIKEKAKQVYNKYLDLDPMLPRDISVAKNLLVDIAYETGIKPDENAIREVLKKLRELK